MHTNSDVYSNGSCSGLSPDFLITAPAGFPPAVFTGDTMQHILLYLIHMAVQREIAPFRCGARAWPGTAKRARTKPCGRIERIKHKRPVTADVSSNPAYLTQPFREGITVTHSRGISPHSASGRRRADCLSMKLYTFYHCRSEFARASFFYSFFICTYMIFRMAQTALQDNLSLRRTTPYPMEEGPAWTPMVAPIWQTGRRADARFPKASVSRFWVSSCSRQASSRS